MSRKYVGVGVGLGLSFGTALGSALQNVPAGIAVGLGLGVALGLVFSGEPDEAVARRKAAADKPLPRPLDL